MYNAILALGPEDASNIEVASPPVAQLFFEHGLDSILDPEDEKKMMNVEWRTIKDREDAHRLLDALFDSYEAQDWKFMNEYLEGRDSGRSE